jgi:hypothetical protein
MESAPPLQFGGRFLSHNDTRFRGAMPSRNAWQVTNDAWRTMHGETGRSRRAVRRKRRRETRGSARR